MFNFFCWKDSLKKTIPSSLNPHSHQITKVSVNIDIEDFHPYLFFSSFNYNLKLLFKLKDDTTTFITFDSIASINSRNKLNIIKSHNFPYFGVLCFDVNNIDKEKKRKKDFFFLPRFLFYFNNNSLSMDFFFHQDETLEKLYTILDNFISSYNLTNLNINSFDFLSNFDEQHNDTYKERVNKAIEEINKKHFKKIVIGTSIETIIDLHAIDAYLFHLYEKNKSCYKYILRNNSSYIFSFSPETLLINSNNNIKTVSLAGSIPIDKKDEELKTPKITKENHFVLDYIKEIVVKYCKNIKISNPNVIKLHNIKHLNYTVTGELINNNFIPLLLDLHPTPALSGVPKKETMAYLHKNEPFSRMWYGGALGMICGNDCHFTVAIRMGTIMDNILTLYAVAGIIDDSISEEEYFEVKKKLEFGFF